MESVEHASDVGVEDGGQNRLRAAYEGDGMSWATRDAHIQLRVDMIRRAHRGRPDVIVDLGCGSAHNTVGVAEAFPDATVIGVDWSRRALTEAASAGLLVASADLDPARVPIKSGTCDVVIVCEVIEHLVHTDEVLAEALRILSPDGVLLMTTPNLAAWFNRILIFAGIQPVFSEVSNEAVYGRPGSEVVGHLRLFTLKALREFVEGSGFDLVEVAGSTYHDVPRLGRWIDRLATRWPAVSADLFVTARPRRTGQPTSV